MKRAGHILERAATHANVAAAFALAAQGKRAKPEVRAFVARWDAEVRDIVEEIATVSWRPAPYRRFVVHDPKTRVIHAAAFRDRVLHHALLRLAGPVFERGASAHSYACRRGRGNRAALAQAVRWTRAGEAFLKLDVRRYFDSVDHEILRGLCRRRFKDAGFLTLLDRQLDSFSVAPGRGLPIGALTSQYLANFYLDGLDRFVVERLGCRAYVRYMDDLVLWHRESARLRDWSEAVAAWLASERGLALKGCPEPHPSEEGVPFLGYRVQPGGRVLLARSSRRRFRARLADLRGALARGAWPAAQVQRRLDALLAFTEVAQCRNWRRRVVAASGLDEEGAP